MRMFSGFRSLRLFSHIRQLLTEVQCRQCLLPVYEVELMQGCNAQHGASDEVLRLP
jgi:hypothetical protein